MRLLNPVQNHVEDRYIAERVTMEPGRETTVLRTLQRRLRENCVVSIGAGGPATTVVQVPFLEGYLGLASGPARLALAADCPLLPVFTLESGPGHYELRIEQPLPLVKERGEDAALSALQQFAKRTEEYVARYSDQWFGWKRAWSPAKTPTPTAFR